jgi:hypothetical protein
MNIYTRVRSIFLVGRLQCPSFLGRQPRQARRACSEHRCSAAA